MHTTEDKPTAQATTGRVYHMNFATGRLEPMRADHLLPVGSLVTYEDIKNPPRRYLVTGEAVDQYGHGQKLICEDGHASHVHAASVDKFGRTGGAWHFVRDPDTGAPVVLDPDAIAAFLVAADAEGARLKAEHEAATQAATEPAAATLAPSGIEVRENTDKDGVEIRFPSKPAASVLSELKAAGWRWSRFSSCWWHRRTSDALAFAHRLAGTAPAAADRACADARGREFAQAYAMPDANW